MVKIAFGITVGLGIFGLVHQKIVDNTWFTWSQFWHHEPLIVMCFVLAVGLIAGNLMRKWRR